MSVDELSYLREVIKHLNEQLSLLKKENEELKEKLEFAFMSFARSEKEFSAPVTAYYTVSKQGKEVLCNTGRPMHLVEVGEKDCKYCGVNIF